MKIAIVGTGISGLTCGYYLHKDHEVTLYEANDYIGGIRRPSILSTMVSSTASTLALSSTTTALIQISSK